MEKSNRLSTIFISTFHAQIENHVIICFFLFVLKIISAILDSFWLEYRKSSSDVHFLYPVNFTIWFQNFIHFFLRFSGSQAINILGSSASNQHNHHQSANGVLCPIHVSRKDQISFISISFIVSQDWIVAKIIFLAICHILFAQAVCELEGQTMAGQIISKILIDLIYSWR